MKDEAGERDREVSSLNSKLLSLQLDIKNLHDVCKRQRKTLQDNQLCMEEAMNSSHLIALKISDHSDTRGAASAMDLRQTSKSTMKIKTITPALRTRSKHRH
ncbi:PMFBP1 isoform 3 [Pan troglodytes]|uniref:Polyamine modulated factor 1 binding protein 1 n=2 Tax=Homininae TaxID=207598 RepID=F8W771_HUMAN|nr:polyamine modulated factor 1 binding protein 1 [Homo sapiens]KAI4056037.1 polyamine modulated factor 1 binding protein 1 [Homo sapiens]PNI31753.1 PMFBP1 isoform 3 [Pan troglodytes]